MTELGPFIWKDPPREGFLHRPKWAAMIAPLRAYPGRWAMFEGAPVAWGHLIAHGKREGIEPGEFETLAHGQTRYREAGRTGRCDLYVRYVGPAQPSSAGAATSIDEATS